MDKTINILKQQITVKGKLWQETKNNDYLIDGIALVDAINILEIRLHGKKITDITFMLP